MCRTIISCSDNRAANVPAQSHPVGASDKECVGKIDHYTPPNGERDASWGPKSFGDSKTR